MADNLKPEDRRKAMRAVKGKGTSLERRLSSTLAGMRLKGWRKNAGDIAGKPDVVFDAQRLAIFIDGCFWHGCAHCRRKLPATNRGYWKRKISRNVALSESVGQRLHGEGWAVVRIWEHDIRESTVMEKVRMKIRQALNRDAENNERAGRKR